MKSFEADGIWWLPDSPENQLPGKLVFSPDKMPCLDINGCFFKFRSLISDDGVLNDLNHPLILGILSDGKKVSLYMNSGYVNKFGTRVLKTQYRCDFIIQDIHIQNEKIEFESLKARYSTLDAWLRISGLEISIPREKKYPAEQINIKYKKPSDIEFYSDETASICFSFSDVFYNPFDFVFGRFVTKASVEQNAYFEIRALDSADFHYGIEKIFQFKNLLTFLTDKATQIISIDISIPSEKIKIPSEEATAKSEKAVQGKVLFAVTTYDDAKELQPHDALCLYSDVKDRFEEIFKTWLQISHDFPSLLNIFLSVYYAKKSVYIEDKFIELMKALEIYGSRLVKGKYQESKIFKNGILKDLKTLVESYPSENDNEFGLSDEFKEVILGKFNFLNGFTLRTKIEKTIQRILPVLPSDFLHEEGAVKQLVTKSAKTRDAFTHYSQNMLKKAAKADEIIKLSYTIQILLKTSILLDLGVPEKLVSELIERHRDYSKEWRPVPENDT